MTAQSEEWGRSRIDYDKRADSYHVACEDSELASTNVVLSIAALEGVGPMELPPLAETVDPDALDRVFAPSASVEGSVSFEYAGYDVTVTSEGKLEIVPGRDATRRRQRRN
ncbi:HalOD1 output domain-containing protein [Halopelagius longus]|uniref:Halobacterial output domain-containing protein n=1 Tax=Halopelagius longus TaxID=1236180 RepID=A0A1H1GFR5_9EURY|nr:HalOD1 output domain-containing protein [Halopelagius longus]RDI69618.1 hypothetical protein DWB78_17755 [Halopelagius longus]SDR12017.1 hypothetical protein SAMN05216278_3642 [Halopelagius longus]